MADNVRCQMCGKLNPPEAEVCQHCKARLKPLIAGVTGTARPAPHEIPEADRDISPQETPLEPGEFSFDISDESEPVSEQAGAEESSLDWLSDFRSGVKIDTSSLQSLDETGALHQTGSLEAGTGGIEGHGSDWLQRLGDAEEGPPEEIPSTLLVEKRPFKPLIGEEPEPQPQGVPEGEMDVSSPETDLAAWLAELNGRHEEKPSVPEVAEVRTAEEAELPDWLKQVDGEQPAISEAETPTETAEETLADGLTSTSEEQPPVYVAETQAETEAAEKPSWIESIGEEQPLAPEVEAAGETIIEEPEVPARIKGVEEQLPVSAIVSETEEAELPDWLKSISAEQPQVVEAEAAVEAGVEEAESPGWLTGINEEQPPISEAGVMAAAGAEEGELPDWLAGISEEQPLISKAGVTEEQAILPEATVQVEPGMEPAWLENLPLPGEGEKPRAPLPSGEATPGEFTPAELPDWLEDMHPEEEIIPADGTFEPISSIMESAGPLAGLHGVLPVQSVAAQVGKPPTPMLKMHLSRRQKEQVTLLRKMLATEEDAAPVNLPAAVVSQRLVRWGIAIILFFASLLPIITGSQQLSLPIPAYEIQQVSQLVGGLAPGTPVLLAFDYEPGLSGEMDAAASAVVDHLMVRGASLALVSTSPIGPVLAEHFVQKIQVKHRYLPGKQYLNLGYIPGGSVGLLSFASLPQRTLPYTIDGKRAWENAPLQNIKKLSDFTLVVVIVDDPETARNWVEQVQPFLGVTPLVMVISAQAEPMVRPYYEGSPRQIQGMVVGLPGGSAYERMTGLEGLGRVYWDAFGIELFLAVAIILVGAMVSFILLALDWHKAASAGTPSDSSSKSKGAREHA